MVIEVEFLFCLFLMLDVFGGVWYNESNSIRDNHYAENTFLFQWLEEGGLINFDIIKKVQKEKFIMYVPNNSLTDEIKSIVRSSQKLKESYYFNFNDPATEEEILNWEIKNNLTIPESYKDWLRFSNGSVIANEFAHFYGTKMICAKNDYLPEDYVLIGEINGDGCFLGYSKITGKFIVYDHGEMIIYEDFKQFLKSLFN
ncbi:MAG: SMI1/KNR4 family protein [Oscillospiraceae bacterium]|nr:SMI1/KNR4 family protein [Oscillospiraceae bacterium]